MANDRATEGSIAQIVRPASVNEKNVWSPNNGSNGGEQIHLTEVYENQCILESRGIKGNVQV